MNILIVAYDTRSLALAASYRVRKFIKYLLEDGNRVTLITSAFDDPDKELSGCLVHCIPDNSQSSKLMRYSKRLFGLPDPMVFWVKKAFNYYQNIKVNDGDIEYILISSPPHGIQKFATLASNKYKTKIICDLRDDFLTNDRIRWLTPIHKYFAKILECEFVNKSNLIILNTEVTHHKFAARHPEHIEKLHVITNGYDFENSATIAKREKNTIIYVGSDYSGFAVECIKSIAIQIKNDSKLQKVKIITAGPGNWSESSNFEFWEHLGLIKQQETDFLVQSAGVLVLLMPPGEREPSGTVPLKAYQYLASNNPIFYFGEKGATSSLLSNFSATYCFERGEIHNFSAIYSSFILEAPSFQKREFAENYSFKSLTKRLKKLILLSK